MRHWNSCLENAYEQLWSNTCLCFCFLFDWSINDDITSAHYVSTLYNQRRHIFLQDICKKEDIDVIPQTWGEINWRLQWSTPAIAEKNGRHQTWRGNVEDHRKSCFTVWEAFIYTKLCWNTVNNSWPANIYTILKVLMFLFLFCFICLIMSWEKCLVMSKTEIVWKAWDIARVLCRIVDDISLAVVCLGFIHSVYW